MAVKNSGDVTMDAYLKKNQTRPEASFKNEEEIEINYPPEIKSMKERKKMKEAVLREHPETLLSDYSGPEYNKVRCNLLFYTDNPTAWHSILLAHMNCIRKGGINKGRQLTLENEQEARLTVNFYHNGTVMVQGPEATLSEFQRKFGQLKKEVQKNLEDPEIKGSADGKSHSAKAVRTTESCPSTPLFLPKAPASPRMKAMQDSFSWLEQDYFLFKDEITNNICQLQEQIDLVNKNNVCSTQLHQVCSAVRQLEEANQEMRRELMCVKQELSNREQHTKALECQLEELRAELRSTISRTGSCKTTAHPQAAENPLRKNTPPSTAPQPPKNMTGNKNHQEELRNQRANPHMSNSSSKPRNITSTFNNKRTGHNGNTNHICSSDHIAILCDSNGNHLNPRRLFPGRRVSKLRCPTIQSAVKLLREGMLDNPSHIIVHTGTNDLSTHRVDVAKAMVNMVTVATNTYPSSKIIISTLLPRKDISQFDIDAINTEIINRCTNIRNVHIAYHEQITSQHLYDRLHIHEGGMRLFAKVLKDTVLNRNQRKDPMIETSNTLPHEDQPENQPSVVGRGVSITDLNKIENMLKFICDQFSAIYSSSLSVQ